MGEEEGWEAPSLRIRPIDWLILGIDFVRRQVSATETLLSNVEHMLVGQANYNAEQQAFADAVRRDIETMGDENG